MLKIKNNKKIKHWIDFTLTLTEREIKSRYKHAAFGFLWMVLNPLFQMIVIGFVFQFFIKFDIDNYFEFLFSGLLTWNFFSLSFSKAVPTFVNERYLIKKAVFPREALVISVILSNLFHLLIGFFLFALLTLSFSLNMIWLIPGLFLLLFFTMGISLLFSSLNVKYRDINFIVQAMLALWFYATPIVYSLSMLPDSFRSIIYLNPLSFIVEVIRFSLSGYPIDDIPIKLGINLAISSVIFILALLVFRNENKNFDDWM